MITRAWNRGVAASVAGTLTLLATVARAQTPLPPLPAKPQGPPPAPLEPGPVDAAPPPVAPASPPSAVAVPTSCERDKECPGDLECRQHQCVPPAAPLPPPPPPLLSPPPPPPPPPAQVIYLPAPPPPPEKVTASGLTFALRGGIGFPTGNGSPNQDLSSTWDYMIPFRLDVSYRLDRHWSIGGYFAFAFLDNWGCDTGDGDTCSDNDIRFGVHAEYRFLPARRFDPWVGGGVGWEIANEVENGPDSNALSKNGPDGHIDLGIDWRASAVWGMGPFFEATMGGYENSTVHSWLIVGWRFRYDSALLAR